MITERTVFVLGAGASKPYGYPIGAELRNEICFNFVNQYHSTILREERSRNRRERLLKSVRDFTETFFKSSTRSIDLFLSRNPEFAEFGKLAIIATILSAEATSKFREEMKETDQDWYSHLFDRMTAEFTTWDQFQSSTSNVSFVTLNYDRSLEHFLYESLANSFSTADVDPIKKEMKRFRFKHVYGLVANLEWQDNGNGVAYKTPLEKIWIPDLIDKIHIIYDEARDQIVLEARELIRKAKRIFILGFGYAKENLHLLGFPDILRPGQEVVGTAKGLSVKEIRDIRENYFVNEDSESTDVILEQVDCITLLRDYL